MDLTEITNQSRQAVTEILEHAGLHKNDIATDNFLLLPPDKLEHKVSK